MNAERRIQRVRKAVPPGRGAARLADSLCDVAVRWARRRLRVQRAGGDLGRDPRGVAGAARDHLRPPRAGGLQWPCPDEDHPGTTRLHETLRAPRARSAASSPAVARADVARLSVHPHHRAIALPVQRRHDDDADAEPESCSGRRPARRLGRGRGTARGFAEGDRVRLVSRYGAAVLPARVSGAVRPGSSSRPSTPLALRIAPPGCTATVALARRRIGR